MYLRGNHSGDANEARAESELRQLVCHRVGSIASDRGMPKKEGQEGSGVFVPSPAANAVLTALFGAEVVGALYALSAGARARIAAPRDPLCSPPRVHGRAPSLRRRGTAVLSARAEDVRRRTRCGVPADLPSDQPREDDLG